MNTDASPRIAGPVRGAAMLALALAAWLASVAAARAQDAQRVLALGGTVTEIVYALGQQDRLVGRDATSTWPPESEALPDVGYVRALAPEGVLSVDPDLIIAEADAGPVETIDVLTAASIPFVTIADGFNAAAITAKIRTVGDALGVPDQAEALVAEVEAALAQAAAAAREDAPKRVLFILSTQGGRIMAAGTDTAAAAIIELAGGVNAIAEFEGYQPLTDEAVGAAAPDVILMMDRGGDHGAGTAELFAMPALSTTPAAETRAVVRMDGLYLLGFGPRTAEAVADLNRQIYGE